MKLNRTTLLVSVTVFILSLMVLTPTVSRANSVEWLLKFDREVGVADYLYQTSEYDRFMNLKDPILNEALAQTESKKEAMLTDPENLKKVRELLKKGDLSADIKLLAETWERVLSQRAAVDKNTQEMGDEIGKIKTNIEGAFHSYQFRVPEIDKTKYGAKNATYSRNEIANILSRSKDWERNKELYFSLAEMGKFFTTREPKPEKLIEMRNDFARKQGYKDFIEMKYQYMFGKSTDEIFKTYFEPILTATEKPARLAVERFLKQNKLKEFYPWHMTYARFGSDKIMDPILPVKTLDKTVRDSFASIGFNLNDKTNFDFADDLFPRPNKYNHGACWLVLNSRTIMDDSGNKVFVRGISRYAANFTQGGIDDYHTAFHETGHAVHNMQVKQSFTGTSNVNLLQDYMAPLMEGIAMTFELLPHDLDWLLKYGKGTKDEIRSAYKKWLDKSIPWRAFNIRRQLQFVYMERDLYKKNPSEWTKTWWDYSRKFMFSTPDEKTNYETLPAWTDIPHYWGANAGTYQQYIIAYMIRDQSYRNLKNKYKTMLKPEPWKDLVKAYMEPGNVGQWDKMVVTLTGEELTPKYLMEELSGKTL